MAPALQGRLVRDQVTFLDWTASVPWQFFWSSASHAPLAAHRRLRRCDRFFVLSGFLITTLLSPRLRTVHHTRCARSIADAWRASARDW